MEIIDIYFEDLKPEIQENLLKKLKMKTPKERNWDTIPMVSYTEQNGEIE